MAKEGKKRKILAILVTQTKPLYFILSPTVCYHIILYVYAIVFDIYYIYYIYYRQTILFYPSLAKKETAQTAVSRPGTGGWFEPFFRPFIDR